VQYLDLSLRREYYDAIVSGTKVFEGRALLGRSAAQLAHLRPRDLLRFTSRAPGRPPLICRITAVSRFPSITAMCQHLHDRSQLDHLLPGCSTVAAAVDLYRSLYPNAAPNTPCLLFRLDRRENLVTVGDAHLVTPPTPFGTLRLEHLQRVVEWQRQCQAAIAAGLPRPNRPSGISDDEFAFVQSSRAVLATVPHTQEATRRARIFMHGYPLEFGPATWFLTFSTDDASSVHVYRYAKGIEHKVWSPQPVSRSVCRACVSASFLFLCSCTDV